MLLYGLAQDIRNRVAMIFKELCERRRCRLVDGDANFIKSAEDSRVVSRGTRKTEFGSFV